MVNVILLFFLFVGSVTNEVSVVPVREVISPQSVGPLLAAGQVGSTCCNKWGVLLLHIWAHPGCQAWGPPTLSYTLPIPCSGLFREGQAGTRAGPPLRWTSAPPPALTTVAATRPVLHKYLWKSICCNLLHVSTLTAMHSHARHLDNNKNCFPKEKAYFPMTLVSFI